MEEKTIKKQGMKLVNFHLPFDEYEQFCSYCNKNNLHYAQQFREFLHKFIVKINKEKD